MNPFWPLESLFKKTILKPFWKDFDVVPPAVEAEPEPKPNPMPTPKKEPVPVPKPVSVLKPVTIEDRIVKIAESYIGKTEKPGNSGFNDPEFEKKMKAVGWQKGQAWCAYMGELIWTEAYADHKILPTISKLFSPSAVSTYSNFHGSKLFVTHATVPVVGAVVVWRHGSGWQGHLGVVVAVDLKNNRMVCVEGNTNDKGGREGYIVASKPRKIIKEFSEQDLNLVGFIYPPK